MDDNNINDIALLHMIIKEAWHTFRDIQHNSVTIRNQRLYDLAQNTLIGTDGNRKLQCDRYINGIHRVEWL